MEEGAQKQKIQTKKVEPKIAGQEFVLVERVQLAASAMQAGGVNGRRRDEAAAKNDDYEKSDKENIVQRKNGRTNKWWVSDLVVADCEKAWIHTGWEDAMQKWYNWLEEMKKKDEKEKMEEMRRISTRWCK